MKKRLLLGLMAMCMAGSSFALEVNECVYTPQGRYKITGANVASSNFVSFDGWTVVTASEKAIDANFSLVQDGDIWCAQSLSATEGEGMSFKFVPSSADGVYVVSYKMKGAPATSIRVKTVDVQTNLVTITGEADGVDPVVVNKAEELTPDWKTFNYAIIGDGTARTYTISFTGMATDIEIADLQIAPAAQIADLRQRDLMLEKMITYRDVYDWSADVLDEVGYNDIVSELEAIGEDTSQADLDDMLATANAILYGEGGFLATNMDDYLAGNVKNYLGINTGSAQAARNGKNYGDWACVDRGEWGANKYPDLGHYQNTNPWANNNPNNAMGVTLQKELTPGSYVFGILGGAALREPKKNSWNNDDGLQPAYGVASIVKFVNGEATDTIASLRKDLSCLEDNLTSFLLPAKIEESGTYEFAFKAWCKEEYKSLKLGSVTYVRDASILGKNDNKYNQKELGYEADVREQITAGRTNLTTAAGYLADANKFWGKAELQAWVNEVEPKIANYELLDQDAIIATFDADSYNKANSTKNAEEGLLVFEVYDTAVKDILAANRRFVAVNDTLESLQVAIDAAEATLKLRVYDAATGKGELMTAIGDAKDCLNSMRKLDYDETNAFIIVSTVLDLNEAVEAFKASVPASAITTIVDIDFEADAVQDAETELYSITGAAGSMVFTNFATDVNDAYPYQQGIWSNGEQLYKGYVRVGNGEGTVEFDPTIEGSMGSNILKVNCDFFLQGLSGRYVGFYLRGNNEGSQEVNVAGFYANYYDNAIDATSNLPIALGSLKYASGSSYNNVAPEGAEGATGTVCAKNSFEVVLDFGEGSMYATTTSANGVVTTEKQAFDKTVPVKFVLKSNYINNDRRVWFDNLKIQRVAAGSAEPFTPDGIEEIVNAENKVVAPSKVLKNGRIVINGKYGINGVLIK